MNPLALIGSFFKWLGWRQSRETSLKTAQLNLSEEQHRAEVFALEQSLQTTESDRERLKAQLISVEKERDAAIRALNTEKDERERLHNQLNLIQQQTSKVRVDREAEKMLVQVATRKDGWAQDVLFKYCFGHEIQKAEFLVVP